MERIKRSTQSLDAALTWFGTFYNQNGRMPSCQETAELRGPTWRLQRRMGGFPGIMNSLGIPADTILKGCIHPTPELTKSLSTWVLKKGIDIPPSRLSADQAYQEKDTLIAASSVYMARFGGWENALSSTGYFRFNWLASECVGMAYRARQAYDLGDIRTSIVKISKRGITPRLSDTLAHFPSLLDLSANRLSWDGWLKPDVSNIIKRRNTISVISHGVLALAQVDGNLQDFDRANEILHKEDRGPEFSKALYSQIAPRHMSEQTGYIWALDLIDRKYTVMAEGTNDARMPVDKLAIGTVSSAELFHPAFLPEFDELKAA